MQSKGLTLVEANLELALLQVEADSVSSSDLYLWLRESGLPPEIAIRLKDLIDFTKKVGEKILSLGKIIVMKLIEFARKNPNLIIGMALGASLSFLVSAVPYLGPILALVAAPFGIAVGALAGHRMDMGRTDKSIGLIEITQDTISLAKEFFALFSETLLAFANEFR
jgi:hypothetical protein